MLFATAGQSRIFLVMLYAGLALGLYSSVDAAARRLFKPGRLLNAIMDLTFGAVAACLIIAALLYASGGELRLYAQMGVACGFLIYQGSLAPLVARALSRFARCLRRIATWLTMQKLLKKLFK